MIRAIVIIITILICTPCFGAESIVDWVNDRNEIKWDATPLDYPERISSLDTILWLGRIEEINAYINDQRETVVEFFCRHLSLLQPGPSGLGEPIQVRDRYTGYFVITVRSPFYALGKALELREANKKTPHYAAVLGEPVDQRLFGEQRAVYIHSAKATMSTTLSLRIID